ncbi:hypothetical protein [Vulcanisaeta distributa]|uniref:hypothetical protein n=1 Tax=Vulcanisaeta distributa TaxID=164451 RepID=UPI0006CFCEBE|nr:hypothetical protein [Vulcanisaeta distributa]
MRIVIVLHGSRDPGYINSVKHFADRVGIDYAFTSFSKPLINEVSGDVYIPLFIGYGKDYDLAVTMTSFETPPLLRWPRVRDFLLSLGPGLYVLHGDNDPRFLNDVSRLNIRDIAFLKIEPTIRNYLMHHCPGKVVPVVFTEGVIYREILTTVSETCRKAEVLRPLFELETFITYFRDLLPWLIQNTRPIG